MELDKKTKEEILPRIKRIEGQIQGIFKMIEERRECPEIITQIYAVKRALEKVALIIMESHIKLHVSQSFKKDINKEKTIRDLTETIFKFLK